MDGMEAIKFFADRSGRDQLCCSEAGRQASGAYDGRSAVFDPAP
jgi:hypothetical protein